MSWGTFSTGQPMSSGTRLVVFTGIDGCGKTTQLALLAAELERRGHVPLCTRQPTEFYRKAEPVRAYIDDGGQQIGMPGLALLAAADRQLHITTELRPSLEAGRWILCDRYLESSIAFFHARGVDRAFVEMINVDVPKPDLTVLLDLPATAARERVLDRDGPTLKFEERSLDFMETVRASFLAQADDSWIVLDGLADQATIADQVRSALAMKALR